jgi:uncharacterized membrane protein YdjX (TVP38/TMEM64 family)
MIRRGRTRRVSEAGESTASGARALFRRLLASRGVHALLGLLVVALVLARFASGDVAALRVRFGVMAGLVLVPLQALISFAPVSGEAMAVANGALFGFWLGSTWNWLAWMLAAWLQYAAIRRTARDFDFEARSARLPRWLRNLPADRPLFLIGVRILFGGPIPNAAAGAFGVSAWRHTWCAAVGNAPRAMFFAGLAALVQ